MNHADILRASASKVNELDNSFGPRELVFDRAARIASALLDMHFTAYDISMITAALNLAHLQGNRNDPTNFVSTMVNVAFAAQFAGAESNPADVAKTNVQNFVRKFTMAPDIETAEAI